MLSLSEYRRHDAVGLASLIQTGEVSAAELLECAIEQTEALNPSLNAVVFKAYDEARAHAAAIHADSEGSLLQGVPFLIKEAAAVAGWPRTHGSRLFAEKRSARDGELAKRIRNGEMVSFGKTNTPELCLTITTESSLYGPCPNPRHPEYSAGGSSGGAAAAVSAGIVPAAHGSDGGGSIRIPASCCGLFGLKPSRGLTVVEEEIGSTWSGMSVNHVLTRTVRDSAAFLDLLRLRRPAWFALPPFQESYYQTHSRPPGPLRVAVHRKHPGDAEVHPDCLAAVDKAARQCEEAGFVLEEQTPPINHELVSSAMGQLINIHVAQIVLPQLEKAGLRLDKAPLEEATRRMAARGARIPATEYLAALDTIKQAERQMAGFLQHFDLILSPVLAQPPAPLGWLDMDGDIKTYASRFTEYSGFTALYNGTGLPSVSVPMHRTAEGLPVGVMFSAGWGEDHLLLQTGAILEEMGGGWPVATLHKNF